MSSAHGVPQSYIKAGDPYQCQMEECVTLICRRAGEMLENGLCPGLSLPEGRAMATGIRTTRADGSTDRAGGLQFHLSFQSRVGPVTWLKPYTEERIAELGQSGVKNLIVVPVSFVSEHIETLEEIDIEYVRNPHCFCYCCAILTSATAVSVFAVVTAITPVLTPSHSTPLHLYTFAPMLQPPWNRYRELAEENGVSAWRRVPALNTDTAFITDMADLVEEALRSPVVSVAEAAAQNSNLLAFSSR